MPLLGVGLVGRGRSQEVQPRFVDSLNVYHADLVGYSQDARQGRGYAMGTVRLSHLPRCAKNSPGYPSPLVDGRLGLLHLCRNTKTILSSLLPAHLTDDGNGALHGSGLEQDVRSDEDMEPNVGGEGDMPPL